MATLLESRHERDIGRPCDALRVGVDATQIVFGVSGGVEVYFRTLVRALLLDDDVDPVVVARADQVPHLRAVFGDDLLIRSLPIIYAPLAVRTARWLRRKLGTAATVQSPPPPSVPFRDVERELDLDVLHSPVQMFADDGFLSPGVLNLHDLQHIHFPENFSPAEREIRNRLYGSSARRADAVIASSEFVRRDIVRHLGLAPENVHLVPVACDPDDFAGAETFSADDAADRYDLPETFAFYPAAFWPHKNHVRLIEALAIVRSRAPQHDLKLVCAGCRAHSGLAAVEEALDRFSVREHVRFLDFIPTEHLGGVYRASTFCVVPSLFEASSYPVIEAQSLGVPAMCSSVTSLPELMAGGAGLLFDPASAEDIADKMLRWLNDPADRREHAERGRARAARDHGLDAYAARMRGVYARITGRDTDV